MSAAKVLLFSSHDITDEELAAVILQAGGILLTQPALWFGGLNEEKGYIWIDRIPCYDGVFDEEGNPLDEDGMILLEQAKMLIGGDFQTWLYISLGRETGSQRLAVRFAHACCQRWPCVVDNDEKNSQLFSCKDIEQLYKEDGAFTGYGR